MTRPRSIDALAAQICQAVRDVRDEDQAWITIDCLNEFLRLDDVQTIDVALAFASAKGWLSPGAQRAPERERPMKHCWRFIMPLDAAVQAKPLTTTLHLKRGAEKPARYVFDPPPGVPQWNGIDDPREIRIEDGRGREQEFTLDRNGFALVKAPSRVRDFYSDEEVKRTYYPEVERLLRDELGASRVFVFDHTVRNAARSGAREPSRRVHNDHTVSSAPRRVRDHLGADAAELLKHRFGVVNVWRPIRGPVLDSPLALCDARSFSDDDLIASDLVYPHVRGETSNVEYKPGHRWFYFSEQQADEAILIRVHDSADDGRARLSFHTSFDNPLAAGAPPRESIEARWLVFFPPGN